MMKISLTIVVSVVVGCGAAIRASRQADISKLLPLWLFEVDFKCNKEYKEGI